MQHLTGLPTTLISPRRLDTFPVHVLFHMVDYVFLPQQLHTIYHTGSFFLGRDTKSISLEA